MTTLADIFEPTLADIYYPESAITKRCQGLRRRRRMRS